MQPDETQPHTVTSPADRPATGGIAPFTQIGVNGEPATASALRQAFADWVFTHFDLSEEQSTDLALAVNEALANAVEHAYVDYAEPGPVRVEARYDDATATVVAVVRDEGSWREPIPDPLHLRGRGIPLMRALTSLAIISSDGDGTCVELRWSGLTLRG